MVLGIITAVIVIISLVIGITSGIEFNKELMSNVDTGSFYVDGTDVSGITSLLGTFSSSVLACLIGAFFVFGGIFISSIIWAVYGIVYLFKNIFKRRKFYEKSTCCR